MQRDAARRHGRRSATSRPIRCRSATSSSPTFRTTSRRQVYDSLEDMLAADVVDALDISATLHIHHTAALLGMSAGKHCLVQKPLAVSVAAGRAMVEAAKQRGLSLGVMENLRYAPSVRVARWLIDQGYLGDIQMIAHWGISTAGVVAGQGRRRHALAAPEAVRRRRGLARHRRAPAPRAALPGRPDRHHLGRDARLRADALRVATGERIACDADDAFFATATFASGAVGQ